MGRDCFISVPVPILRAVQGCALILGVHVVDVLPAPARGVGFVLVRAQPPFVVAHRRVHGNAAQELQLAAGGVVGHRHAVHQRLQVGRIALAVGLQLRGRNLAGIGRVLELVDRRPHVAQHATQFGFPGPLDRHPGERLNR